MQSSNLNAALEMRNAYKTKHKAEAFEYGYNNAYGLACYNVPRVGCEYWTESDGKIVPENASEARNLHISLCYSDESMSRCFSSWEFIAARINDLDEFIADAAWEAYEAGVSAAIKHDVAKYCDNDYMRNT